MMAEATIDPGREPRHVVLVAVWLRRAVRAALPVPGGGGTRDPDIIARRAASVPPASLGAPYVTTAR